MMNAEAALLAILILWNLVTYALMGLDKHRAVKSRRRISERTLFLCAFLFGGIGVLAGMYVFRHKTRHWSFRIIVPVAVIANIAAGYAVFRSMAGN